MYGNTAGNTGFSLNMSVEFGLYILCLLPIFNDFEVQASGCMDFFRLWFSCSDGRCEEFGANSSLHWYWTWTEAHWDWKASRRLACYWRTSCRETFSLFLGEHSPKEPFPRLLLNQDMYRLVQRSCTIFHPCYLRSSHTWELSSCMQDEHRMPSTASPSSKKARTSSMGVDLLLNLTVFLKFIPSFHIRREILRNWTFIANLRWSLNIGREARWTEVRSQHCLQTNLRCLTKLPPTRSFNYHHNFFVHAFSPFSSTPNPFHFRSLRNRLPFSPWHNYSCLCLPQCFLFGNSKAPHTRLKNATTSFNLSDTLFGQVNGGITQELAKVWSTEFMVVVTYVQWNLLSFVC